MSFDCKRTNKRRKIGMNESIYYEKKNDDDYDVESVPD